VAHYKVSGLASMSFAKTAFEIPFGMWTPVGRRKHVLDAGAC